MLITQAAWNKPFSGFKTARNEFLSLMPAKVDCIDNLHVLFFLQSKWKNSVWTLSPCSFAALNWTLPLLIFTVLSLKGEFLPNLWNLWTLYIINLIMSKRLAVKLKAKLFSFSPRRKELTFYFSMNFYQTDAHKVLFFSAHITGLKSQNEQMLTEVKGYFRIDCICTGNMSSHSLYIYYFMIVVTALSLRSSGSFIKP